jgi:hypothetical protein
MRNGRKGSEPIDHPHNPVAHMRDMKIQYETEFESAQAEIAEQLGAMHEKNRRQCFKLNDNSIFDKQVNPIPVVYDQLLVADGQKDLCSCAQPLLF